MNNKVAKDLSIEEKVDAKLMLDYIAKNFSAKELKVLNRECGLLKSFQFFFYPMFTAYALFNVFFRTYERWEQYVYPLIYATSLAIMIWAHRWGIGKYQEDIDMLEKQMGQELEEA